MPTPDREALSAFFAIHNTQFNRCLAPGIKCDKTAIRAHSIQNSRALDLLVADNHVIAFRPRASATGITIDFNSVGATTPLPSQDFALNTIGRFLHRLTERH